MIDGRTAGGAEEDQIAGGEFLFCDGQGVLALLGRRAGEFKPVDTIKDHHDESGAVSPRKGLTAITIRSANPAARFADEAARLVRADGDGMADALYFFSGSGNFL